MLVIGRIFRKLFSYIRIGCIKLFRKNITLGKKLSFRKRFTINCSREGKLAIGDNVFFNNDCSLNVRQSVTIGNDSIFGEAVKIYDHNHVFKTKGQKVADQGFSCKPVVIGNNCWIGSNAVILAGTEIGDNTVIGSGCVVHGVIPPDSVLKNSSNYTNDMSNNLTTPKVSVIMPVYNSKQFLPEAIESVLKQSMSDFELILVNDGSTDGSAEVCDKYADTDGRIRVIHKKNGGVCSARNVGIDASRSEYVTFIDNDDYYDTDFLEVLFSGIISENADLAKCGRKNIRITPENKILKETENTYLDVCLDKEEFSEQYIRIKLSGIYSSVWNGLYRKSILVENNVRFDENVVHGNEDIIFNSVYSLYCSRFLFVRKSLYTHFYRIGHSTSTKFYDDQVSTRIQALNMEMNLTQNEDSKNIIALEGIRECFRLLLPIKEHKKRLEYIDYIKRNMDFNVLKKNKILSADLLSKVAKADLILIKNRAYRLYFSLRKLMA